MTNHLIRPKQNRGLSLIELLVSMAIGLIVIGVGASSYIDVITNTRSANVLGQMTEDANIALGIMRSQVLLAGYSRPIGVQPDGSGMIRAFKGGRTVAGDANSFIVGCDGGFTNPKAHELDINQLACTAPPTGTTQSSAPDAIAVVYEADTDNTYPTTDPTPLPTDCVGVGIPAQTAVGIAGLRLASNKFYVNGNTLFCQGNGRTSPVDPASDTLDGDAQALVENIYDMQILYGVAGTTTTGAVTTVDKAAVAYLTATQLNSVTGADRWNRVVSARICVEVRSSSKVTSGEQKKYVNCQGAVVDAPTDHLARTFSTTVVLHNRI